MTIQLSWDSNPHHKSWSAELTTAVTAHLPSLEKGNPDSFIAGYNTLSADNKIKFWAEMIIGMMKYESAFNPHSIYHEPPPLGVDSVGLLQLSYEDSNHYDLEHLDKNLKSLEDPLINIRCGLVILAYWTAKDKTVAKGSNTASAKGAARYWSVVREGTNHHLKAIRTDVKNSVGL